LISNINAVQAVTEILRTTLGPCGMDKLIYDSSSNKVTISNDGATIIKLLDIVHPAARTLVDIAKSQDEEVRSSDKKKKEFINSVVDKHIFILSHVVVVVVVNVIIV
jgi:hypothetical protein